MKEILERKESFSKELKPISIQIEKYLNNNSNIDELVLNVLHRPWIAPLNWGLMLYRGAKAEWFSEYEEMTGKVIPNFYKEFLTNINGAFIYGISLYGLTPSIFEKGLLNRTRLQCHDLATANNRWNINYKVDQNLFYFGGRHYSDDENVGYFWKNNIILCYRTNGKLLKQWNTFEEMLSEEIEIAEKMMLEEVPKEYTIKIN